MLPRLNLPEYTFKIKTENGSEKIFDERRKKYVALTPEEWVRQHFLEYLVAEKRFPSSLIGVETVVKYNGMSKRTDAVVHDRAGRPAVIVECKAPGIALSEETVYQAARYNFQLQAGYLIITNGLKHYCLKMDYEKKSFGFIPEIPLWEDI